MFNLFNVVCFIIQFLTLDYAFLISASFRLPKYSMKKGQGGKKFWLKSVNKFHKVYNPYEVLVYSFNIIQLESDIV